VSQRFVVQGSNNLGLWARFLLRSGLEPGHLIADRDVACDEYLRERPAAPLLAHRSLQSGNEVFHLFARTRLSEDDELHGADL